MGELVIEPESYVHFTEPRSGIFGRVIQSPPGFQVERFLAFIMSDGCDYDFTDKIAYAWRVMLGDGVPDYETTWFPTLKGDSVYFGYGTVAIDREHLDACNR